MGNYGALRHRINFNGGKKMYNFAPVSDRVAAIRDKYRNSYPTFSSERCRIITDFYKENPNMPGQLKRAYNLYNLIEKMTALGANIRRLEE